MEDLNEELIFRHHESLLESLKFERSSWKKLLLQKERRNPLQQYFDQLQFSEDEARYMISKSINNTLTAGDLEKLLTEKVISTAVEVNNEEEYRKQELNNIRNDMRELDVNHRLTGEKLLQHPMDKISSSVGWQKWSGNAKLPKRLKYLLVNSEVAEIQGPPISIPFKPLHWAQITNQRHDRDDQSEDNNSRASSMTSGKRGGGGGYRSTATLFDETNWARANFHQFISSIPWLNGWSNAAISELEKVLSVQEFGDGQAVVKSGSVLPFCFIRSGQVDMMRVSSHSFEKIRSLYSGDVFGFDDLRIGEQDEDEDEDEDEDDAKEEGNRRASSLYTFVAHGSVTLYFCTLTAFFTILYQHKPLRGVFSNVTLPINKTTKEQFQRLLIQYGQLGLTLQPSFTPLYLNRIELEDELQHDYHVDLLIRIERFLFTWKHHKQVHHFNIILSQLLKLCQNEFTFSEIIVEWLQLIKSLFTVDRISLYSVDHQQDIMYLFTLTNMPGSVVANKTGGVEESKESYQLFTIRMPLKGIASHVSKQMMLLNLEDCYKSEYFDSTMDLKTGYRSKQMLCVPIQNYYQENIGVLQLINPLSADTSTTNGRGGNRGGGFSGCEEELAMIVGDMIVPILSAIQQRVFSQPLPFSSNGGNSLLTVPADRLPHQNIRDSVIRDKPVQLRLLNIQFLPKSSNLPHRHFQFTFTLYYHGHALSSTTLLFATPVMSSPNKLYTTPPINSSSGDGNLISCSLEDVVIQFPDLAYQDLLPGMHLLIEMKSKNSHSIAWTLCSLFTYDSYLVAGNSSMPMIKGQCPKEYPVEMFERMQLVLRYTNILNTNHDIASLYENKEQHSAVEDHNSIWKKWLSEWFVGLIQVNCGNYQIPQPIYYQSHITFPLCLQLNRSTRTSTQVTATSGSYYENSEEKMNVSLPDWLRTISTLSANDYERYCTSISFYQMYLLPLVPAVANTTTATSPSAANATTKPVDIEQWNSFSIGEEFVGFVWQHLETLLTIAPSATLPLLLNTADYFITTLYGTMNPSASNPRLSSPSRSASNKKPPQHLGALLAIQQLYQRYHEANSENATVASPSKKPNSRGQSADMICHDSLYFFSQLFSTYVSNFSVATAVLFLDSRHYLSDRMKHYAIHSLESFFTTKRGFRKKSAGTSLISARMTNKPSLTYKSTVQAILPFLLHLLSGEGYHRDNVYVRFLLSLCQEYPIDVAFPLFWQLQVGLHYQSPILHTQYVLFLQDLLTVIPLDMKLKLMNGWKILHGSIVGYLTHRNEVYTLDDFFQEVSEQYGPEGEGHYSDMFYFPDTFSLSKRIRSTLSSSSSSPQDQYDVLQCNRLSKIQKVKYSAKKFDGIAFVTELSCQKVVSRGGGNDNNSPSRRLSSASSLAAQAAPFTSTLHFIPECNYKLEQLYSWMLSACTFIWQSSDVTSLVNITPETLSLGGPICQGVLMKHSQQTVTLHSLITQFVSTTTSSNGSANTMPGEIPGHLLTRFFEDANHIPALGGHPSIEGTSSLGECISEFAASLAAYLISQYVFGIGGSHVTNANISMHGTITLSSPTQFFGLTEAMYQPSFPVNEISSDEKRSPLLFMPCFVETLGGMQSNIYREFVELVNCGFLALRTEAALLMWMTQAYFASLELPPLMNNMAICYLRDSLLLHMTDKQAIQELWTHAHRGLNRDYLLKVR